MVRSVLTKTLVAGAALAAGASAHAAVFSFPSDSNTNQWTFTGGAAAGGFFDISTPTTPPTITLNVDNGASLPTLNVQATMVVNLTAHLANSAAIFGTTYEHDYYVDGTIKFVNPSNPGDEWLVIKVGTATGPGSSPGRLTQIGTATAWGSAGNIAGSSSTGSVSYTENSAFRDLINSLAPAGKTALDYGVGVGTVATNTDFSFTQTVVNQGGDSGTVIGPLVSLDSSSKLPSTGWRSEGSFTGDAEIPAPGAAALLLAGATVGLRRRPTR